MGSAALSVEPAMYTTVSVESAAPPQARLAGRLARHGADDLGRAGDRGQAARVHPEAFAERFVPRAGVADVGQPRDGDVARVGTEAPGQPARDERVGEADGVRGAVGVGPLIPQP